jgi:hypothetical protein
VKESNAAKKLSKKDLAVLTSSAQNGRPLSWKFFDTKGSRFVNQTSAAMCFIIRPFAGSTEQKFPTTQRRDIHKRRRRPGLRTRPSSSASSGRWPKLCRPPKLQFSPPSARPMCCSDVKFAIRSKLVDLSGLLCGKWPLEATSVALIFVSFIFGRGRSWNCHGRCRSENRRGRSSNRPVIRVNDDRVVRVALLPLASSPGGSTELISMFRRVTFVGRGLRRMRPADLLPFIPQVLERGDLKVTVTATR